MPVVRVTRVLPTLRVVNMEGALTSYQSFLVKGSTLCKEDGSSSSYARCSTMIGRTANDATESAGLASTHIFFLPPFLPLVRRLFLPTAIVKVLG